MREVEVSPSGLPRAANLEPARIATELSPNAYSTIDAAEASVQRTLQELSSARTTEAVETGSNAVRAEVERIQAITAEVNKAIGESRNIPSAAVVEDRIARVDALVKEVQEAKSVAQRIVPENYPAIQSLDDSVN